LLDGLHWHVQAVLVIEQPFEVMMLVERPCAIIFCVHNDRRRSQLTRLVQTALQRIHQEQRAPTLTGEAAIDGEATDEHSGQLLVAREALGQLGGQLSWLDRERRQRVVADDARRIVGVSDKRRGDVVASVLAGLLFQVPIKGLDTA
jgi:hypothetical protein